MTINLKYTILDAGLLSITYKHDHIIFTYTGNMGSTTQQVNSQLKRNGYPTVQDMLNHGAVQKGSPDYLWKLKIHANTLAELMNKPQINQYTFRHMIRVPIYTRNGKWNGFLSDIHILTDSTDNPNIDMRFPKKSLFVKTKYNDADVLHPYQTSLNECSFANAFAYSDNPEFAKLINNKHATPIAIPIFTKRKITHV